EEISLISLAGRTLGTGGKIVSWLCFLFLFYALGVAYIAGSGELIAEFAARTAHIEIPHWFGSLLVSFLFGILVYLGTKPVDIFNRILMGGLIVSYFLLVAL